MDWYTTQAAAAPTYSVVGDVYALLATGEQTGGAFSLAHAIVPPGGGPPPHTHSREDESFYVLHGTVTFYADIGGPGETRTEAGPGAFVHLRRGVKHRFANETGEPARMLIHTAPAGFEKMVVAAGTPLAPGTTEPVPTDAGAIGRLLEACAEAGIALDLPAVGH